jgi:RimJ/RimL family protein N-acetyltransferase
MIEIVELDKQRLDSFLQYLSVHLSENGANDQTVFLPLSRKQSVLGNEWREKFELGLSKRFGEFGWRKCWLASSDGKIIGHIDIRSYNQLNTEHRVLLGMGVDSQFRNRKVGQQLLDFVITFCKNSPEIAWLDLHVMANNLKAIELYKKLDFILVGKMDDMFRFDGKRYDYLHMSLKVE